MKAKEFATAFQNKVRQVVKLPKEAEWIFGTKILTQFYNSKEILRDESFQFQPQYNHEKAIKEIQKFISLLTQTGVWDYLDDFSFIERVIKWLLVFNNPAGQV